MNSEKKLLIVDDDEVDFLYLVDLLDQSGQQFSTQHAHDGEEGLDVLQDLISQKQPLPEAIFLDVKMPRMTGYEFLQELKRDDTLDKIPVVLLSTSEQETEKIQTEDLNIVGFFLKETLTPFQIEKILHLCDVRV